MDDRHTAMPFDESTLSLDSTDSALTSDAAAIKPEAIQNTAKALRALTQGFDQATLWWASGFLAGLATQTQSTTSLAPSVVMSAPSKAQVDQGVAIVFGSQTGNSKLVATQLAQACDQQAVKYQLINARDLSVRALRQLSQLWICISTQGDGDPPDDARGFVEDLLSSRAPQLPQLQFAVFGLGDSSYAKFCEIGKALDRRFAELGATRLLDRVDADVDFQSPALAWVEKALVRVGQIRSTEITSSDPPQIGRIPSAAPPAWVEARVLVNQRITDAKSEKDVRHIELDLSGSSQRFEPGDALAVVPVNSKATVDALIAALSLDAQAMVELGAERLTLKDMLTERLEITRLHPGLLEFFAARNTRLFERLATCSINELLPQFQLAELALHYPIEVDLQTLVAQLKPIKAREYSIASAQAAVGDEVHLTVQRVTQVRDDRVWNGTGSNYLAELSEQQSVRVKVVRNPRFRLPQDPTSPIIMIGPGTGIAPFRAFVQQRAQVAETRRGKHWLFFGNPHFRSDFLYQLEWQKALKNGDLSKLSLAFSRDQAEKRYVQHLMLESAAELYQWLNDGAYLYVCGDAKHMAKDVEQALLRILAHRGNLRSSADPDFATQMMRTLRAQARYQRDVY